ncbi:MULTISPECIES: hypothetical protein [Novosphingobium]|uniref:Uncharacterized protein n=1 Tax=Novosphingobium subterraneum TaxID=48936 RepID=A0A0B8ZRC4_9SPHN|nr:MULTISPECIES: hypothetical protein [Novosphingobium]KHS48752.1 hypothetical protein NJ75_00834 [Novosphingobium subterraneum]QOV93477.1 hypothetical protein IM701_12775 [Novosphingobium sp. ES2-1]
MQRDRRLLAALLLFLVSLLTGAVQAWIVNAYVRSAISGGWESFADFFGLDAPAKGPAAYCIDFCGPELPFMAGWIAIGAFVSGLMILAFAWWKPKA